MLHNGKTLFSIMDERNSVFFLILLWNSAELLDCAFSFKFYLNVFTFLNINTNQTSKEQYLN